MALLEIEDLTVEFPTQAGVLRAVDGVSLSLDEGDVLGIVVQAIAFVLVIVAAALTPAPVRAAQPSAAAA